MNGQVQTAAKRWFHAGAWIGLAATAYTNYRAAPVADLQVAYLIVPVLLAAVSEGLIVGWRHLPAALRGAGVLGLFALLTTSYEHLRHLTLESGGTEYAANVGSAVIDVTIFVCVLATAALNGVPELPETGNRNVEIPELPETGNRNVEIPELPETGNRNVEIPELSAVPEFVPAATWFAEHPAPTSGAPVRRRAKQEEDLAAMRKAFGSELPGATDIMKTLGCGGSRATRLRALWAEHLESTGGTQN